MTWPTVTALVERGDNGCDWWRAVVPFKHLRESGYPVWLSTYGSALVHRPDVLVGTHLGMGNAGLSMCHNKRIAVVADYDDDFRLIPSESPLYKPDMMAYGEETLYRADLVTCTTPRLAERFRLLNPHVEVVPNLIDPDQWDLPARPASDRIVIGTHGGGSHFDGWRDLPGIWSALAEKYPQTDYLLVGYKPDWWDALSVILGPRLRFLPWVDCTRYQANVNQIDIGLAILTDSVFDSCRSPIKWMEYSLCHTPVVASRVPYGDWVRDGGTGLLADQPAEFIQQLGRLVESAELRRRIAERAYREVAMRHSAHSSAALMERMSIYRDCWARCFGGADEREYHADRAEGARSG